MMSLYPVVAWLRPLSGVDSDRLEVYRGNGANVRRLRNSVVPYGLQPLYISEADPP